MVRFKKRMWITNGIPYNKLKYHKVQYVVKILMTIYLRFSLLIQVLHIRTTCKARNSSVMKHLHRPPWKMIIISNDSRYGFPHPPPPPKKKKVLYSIYKSLVLLTVIPHLLIQRNINLLLTNWRAKINIWSTKLHQCKIILLHSRHWRVIIRQKRILLLTSLLNSALLISLKQYDLNSLLCL